MNFKVSLTDLKFQNRVLEQTLLDTNNEYSKTIAGDTWEEEKKNHSRI